PNRVRLEATVEAPDHPVLVEAERQLREYFAGERKSFTVKLDYRGTPFQKKVWNALLAIPFGETRTYGELARQIGSPAAVRAVGRGGRHAAGTRPPSSPRPPASGGGRASPPAAGAGWRPSPSCGGPRAATSTMRP